jgi:hypothetical protein
MVFAPSILKRETGLLAGWLVGWLVIASYLGQFVNCFPVPVTAVAAGSSTGIAVASRLVPSSASATHGVMDLSIDWLRSGYCVLVGSNTEYGCKVNQK